MVVRVIKNGNYTVMSNYHLRDNRLSLKAVGLLSKILSLPEDWDYTIAGLSTICQEGKAAIRAALQELEDKGYIERRQTHTAEGLFSGNEYVIYEDPTNRPPLCENQTTESPLCSFPSSDNPSTENRTELNKDILNTDLTKTPKAPKGGRRVKSQAEWQPQMFENFWASYPRHEDRGGAVKEWDALKPDSVLIGEMAQALKAQKATEMWQRGIGIPYAVRWLRYRRWTDEVQSEGSWAEDPEVQYGA